MSGKTRGIVITVIVVIGILIGGYFWLSQKQPKHTGPVERITVAVCEEYSTLVWIAQDRGYFADNDLCVLIRNYRSGKQATDALLAEEADISTAAAFVFVSNSFINPDLRTFGMIDAIENMELIARKDHGISQPSDLKGKKIGVTKKSTGEFFLGTFLTFKELSIKDVEFVDLNPNEIVEAIATGGIDAAFTWEPNIFNIKNILGDNAISWPGQFGQPYYFVLITREKWLTDNPETAKCFLRALVQAEEYIKTNNEEVKELIGRRYNYESDYMNDAWQKHTFAVTFPQTVMIFLSDQANWAIKNNLTDVTEIPNYLDYIYPDALDEVKPEAVTIIH